MCEREAQVSPYDLERPILSLDEPQRSVGPAFERRKDPGLPNLSSDTSNLA